MFFLSKSIMFGRKCCLNFSQKRPTQMLASFVISMKNMFAPMEMNDIVRVHFSDPSKTLLLEMRYFASKCIGTYFHNPRYLFISQEDEEAPIYWCTNILFWSFWKGSNKTGFCVSHDGQTNWLETCCLPCFMFDNKTKHRHRQSHHSFLLIWLF